MKLFNSQNSVSTNINEVFSILIKYVTPDSVFWFWDEYIASSSFEEGDFEIMTYLLEETREKPRYIPTKSNLH